MRTSVCSRPYNTEPQSAISDDLERKLFNATEGLVTKDPIVQHAIGCTSNRSIEYFGAIHRRDSSYWWQIWIASSCSRITTPPLVGVARQSPPPMVERTSMSDKKQGLYNGKGR